MMKIRLLQPARILMPAGSEVEVPESLGIQLVNTGYAENIKTVTKAVKAPAEKRNKTK